MTVAELRAALEALPAEAAWCTVVLSRDAEGNGFSPLSEVGRGSYTPTSRAQGVFCDEHDLEGQPEVGESWGDGLVALTALCLWPAR